MYRQYPSPVGIPNPLQFLGAPVSVRLVNGDLVRGDVFCYDMDGSKTVVLREQSDFPTNRPGSFSSFRIIEVQHIREISGHAPPPAVIDPWLPPCDPKVLEERERAAIAAFEAKRHTIGIGVTQEAQEIFNFIHKTHPDCCWTPDRRISVMGVLVNPPYGAEDCEGSGSALDRIKQVVQRYRERREIDKQRGIPTQQNISNQQQPQLSHVLPSAVPIGMDGGGYLEMVGSTGAPVDYQCVKIGPNGFPTSMVSPASPMGSQPGTPGVYVMVVHPGGTDEGGMLQRGGPAGMQQPPMVTQDSSEHPQGSFMPPFFAQGQSSTNPQQQPGASVSDASNGATRNAEAPPSDGRDDNVGIPQDMSNSQGDPSRAQLEHPRSPVAQEQQQAGNTADVVMSPGRSILRPFPDGTFNYYGRADSNAISSAMSTDSSSITPEAAAAAGGWQTQTRHSGGKNSRNQPRRGGGGNKNRRDI